MNQAYPYPNKTRVFFQSMKDQGFAIGLLVKGNKANYSDSHKTSPEGVLKLDSSSSCAHTSVDLRKVLRKGLVPLIFNA
jgi:hypothetical protein